MVFSSPLVSIANDSVSAGRNGVLDSLIFAGTYFTDGLNPGNYKIGLYVRPGKKNGDVGAYQYFGVVPIGFDSFFQPMEWLEALPLRCWIDVFDVAPGEIKVSGWAFIQGQSTFSNRIEVVLKADGRIYHTLTDPSIRRDLTGYFNSTQNLSTGGFVSFISTKGMERGDYELGIRVINEKTHQEAIQYMGRYFSIK